MRRRVLALVAVLVTVWGAARPLQAQLTFVTPASATAPASDVDAVLSQGQELEGQRRWGEALSLYEDALRRHPTDAALGDRIQRSRLHYDLSRRYNDASYRQSLDRMPLGQALELYGEVLTKIQGHYVERPDWHTLARRGTRGLETALGDPLFVETHLASVPGAQIERFRRDLGAQLATMRVASREAALSEASYVARLARQRLGLAETATVLELVCGTTNALDPYSTFLTSGQLNEVYSQIEGNFVGLGVELKDSDRALQVVHVIAGSPAERAGLLAGDRIVAVDGRSTTAMSTVEAANLLQGPEGSTVDVTVVTAAQPPRTVRVRREQVEVPSVADVRMLDPQSGVAYLRITCFQKTTTRDLDAAMWRLHREGMRSLIVDLRGNPGGLLTTSVDVVDKFVDQGVIVSTRGRNTTEDYSYSAHTAGTWRVPLVVLIDGDSASASEIFAGAIRDHRRGVIVGTRSYGKGSVQGIFPLAVGNTGLRLTTAKFYSPLGHPYSEVGVQPDVVVHQTARPVGAELAAREGDPFLDAALGVAREQVAQR